MVAKEKEGDYVTAEQCRMKVKQLKKDYEGQRLI